MLYTTDTKHSPHPLGNFSKYGHGSSRHSLLMPVTMRLIVVSRNGFVHEKVVVNIKLLFFSRY